MVRLLERLVLAIALIGAPIGGYAHALSHCLQQQAVADRAADDGRTDKAHRDAGCAQCVAYAGFAFGATSGDGRPVALVAGALAPNPLHAPAFLPATHVPFASRAPPR